MGLKDRLNNIGRVLSGQGYLREAGDREEVSIDSAMTEVVPWNEAVDRYNANPVNARVNKNGVTEYHRKPIE